MTNPSPPDYFTPAAALVYHERNRPLAPIADSMHFLIRLILRDLDVRSHILCVGVGTGAEILSLAKAFPEWIFVGVDPSASMLGVCRERLAAAGILDRCQLIQGYVQDVPPGENFDAVLGILVAHFVKQDERAAFYQAMHDRLRAGAYLINTEISFDLNAEEFPSMLKNWEGVQSLMGATPESLATLPHQLRTMLSVISPAETEKILRQCGFPLPTRFFQAFMISGWYARKNPD